MTPSLSTRELILTACAEHGPRHIRRFPGCDTANDYARLMTTCCKMERQGILKWTAPATFDLGPAAPAWATRLRALLCEVAELRAQLAGKKEPV